MIFENYIWRKFVINNAYNDGDNPKGYIGYKCQNRPIIFWYKFGTKFLKSNNNTINLEKIHLKTKEINIHLKN
jgi:hypothetical protein